MNSPPTSGLCNTPWIMRWHYFLIEACPNISAGRLEAKTGCTTALLKPCSLLTHQAQSCKTKTNIYLYKHALVFVNLFLYLTCQKPCRRQVEPAAASTAGRAGLELAACSHFGFQHCRPPSEAASLAAVQQIPECHGCPQPPSIGPDSLR